ncbi:DUF1534 domain-containing protein [Pseudomonas syringae pv. pisi str. PP1]|nr:DUF1534 domain-containing protein [Pseudomonas syringae pv. pisi str. PP1]
MNIVGRELLPGGWMHSLPGIALAHRSALHRRSRRGRRAPRTAYPRGAWARWCSSGHLSFLTLQRGNALGAAPRHRCVLRHTYKGLVGASLLAKRPVQTPENRALDAPSSRAMRTAARTPLAPDNHTTSRRILC